MERYTSKGIYEFREPFGQMSIHDFRLDENGYVRTDYDNASRGEERYACSQDSKKWFFIEQELDCFPITKNKGIKFKKKGANIRCMASRVWCMYGFRVVIEYFDTNVLLEVQNKMYDCGYDRDGAIAKLLEDAINFGEDFEVGVVGDLGFINIRKK